MNTFWVIILVIANIIITTVIHLFFKNYLPSYFTEKGKNLAQKEDISKITSIVEDIKSEHIRSQEQIKSQLSLLTLRNNAIDSQARQAVLDFYDQSIEFIGTKFAISFGKRMGTLDEHVKFIKEYDQSISDSINEIYRLYYRLFIYFESDSPIMKTAGNILLCAFELKEVYDKYFPKLKTSFLYEVQNMGTIDKIEYSNSVKATNDASKKYYDNLNPALKKANETFNLYIIEVNKFLNINNQVKI